MGLTWAYACRIDIRKCGRQWPGNVNGNVNGAAWGMVMSVLQAQDR